MLAGKRPLRPGWHRSSCCWSPAAGLRPAGQPRAAVSTRFFAQLTAEAAVPTRSVLSRQPRRLSLHKLYYAVPAFVNASSASESVGNIRKICSTRVISKTFNTRLFTPVRAIRRPDLAQEVHALTNDPSPEESR